MKTNQTTREDKLNIYGFECATTIETIVTVFNRVKNNIGKSIVIVYHGYDKTIEIDEIDNEYILSLSSNEFPIVDSSFVKLFDVAEFDTSNVIDFFELSRNYIEPLLLKKIAAIYSL